MQIGSTLATVLITFLGVTHCRECNFIDVRNKALELTRLNGCTAVLGFLQIMLIDHDTPKDFENYSFPELREITGFFMLYRVPGLLSLKKLFPNLSIIRGNELLMNYAFIMHEMLNFQEIGLPSLQIISRGNVRIQRCPSICDAKTFNWKKITNSTSNFFYDYGQKCTRRQKQINGSSKKMCTLLGNQTECFVPVKDKQKEIPLSQCHELCIIGCHNKTARGCYVCKGPRDDGVCVEKCPETKIYDESFMRCLTRQQCRSHKKFIFEEKLLCVSICPKGYIEQDSKNNYENYDQQCYPCKDGVCPKVCLGADINYVEDGYKLQGCQIVSGSIHININIAADGPDLMEELIKCLGSIEEIYGFLKIYRSYPITSLDFLKNLKTIHGTELQNNYYALFVYENNNLQALWTPRPDFKILNGTILFYSNDKLCSNVVEEFLDEIGQNDTIVNLESNGSRHSCNSTVIDVKSEVLSPNLVTIYWEPFPLELSVNLTGYLINYVESTDMNVTHFYGTYSCTVTAWNTKSVKKSKAIRDGNDYLSFNLTRLSSMTQYAFYVRTDFEGNSYRKQGQSPIRYFKTPVDSLTQVLNLKTYAKTSTSVTLQWNLMPKEEEYIRFYSVDILRQPDDLVIYRRDFCQNPQENSAYEEMEELEPGNEKCCCQNEQQNLDYGTWDEAMEEEDVIKIEEEVTIADVTKYKYYVNTTLFMPNQTDGNRYEITGLKPYTLYSFQFFACMTIKMCSEYAFHSDRTRPENNDVVLVNVQQNGERNETVIVEFEAKNETNGAIVGYVIEEKREAQDVTESKCFSLVQNPVWNHTYTLPAGVIQLRFQTISLAGLGPFTNWINITVLEVQEKPSAFSSLMIALLVSSLICGSFYGLIWFKHNRKRIFRSTPPVNRNEMEMLILGIHESNVDDDILMHEIPLGNVHFDEADFY